MIIIASVLWGTIGIFVRKMSAMGFNAFQITTIRCIVTAMLLFLYLLVLDPSKLKVKLKDIRSMAGMGICSIVFFNVCYFTTIKLCSLSIAAILLYTAPSMVTVMSVLFFREKLNWVKIIALLLSFMGCVLVAGVGGRITLQVLGLFTGLGSGFGYALYSILGTIALKKYHPLTVMTYTFLFACIGAIPISNVEEMISIIHINPYQIIFLILQAVLTSVIPYILYTTGLNYIEASKASIMASLEPMVATLVGFMLFHEKLSVLNMLGVILILFAVILLNQKNS
jgi:drug/metabolite transporter (DMT)-like permease